MEKKVVVDVSEFEFGYAVSGGVGFALVSRPYKRIHRQATYIRVCRDYINDDIISFVNKGGRMVGDIDTARLRLLVCTHESKKDYVFSAKHIINIYEDLAGFKTRSKIVTPKYNGKGSAWLITGPGEWMLCSQLVSMLTLIIRIVCHTKLEKPNNIEELEHSWRRVIKGYNDDSFINSDAYEYLPECYPKWRMMMENFYDLFDPSIEFYPKNRNWHSAGGIYQLCRFKSTISKLDKKMKKLWMKKYRKRYKNVH